MAYTYIRLRITKYAAKVSRRRLDDVGTRDAGTRSDVRSIDRCASLQLSVQMLLHVQHTCSRAIRSQPSKFYGALWASEMSPCWMHGGTAPCRHGCIARPLPDTGRVCLAGVSNITAYLDQDQVLSFKPFLSLGCRTQVPVRRRHGETSGIPLLFVDAADAARTSRAMSKH